MGELEGYGWVWLLNARLGYRIMADHRRFRLPSLKVTVRDTTGKSERKIVHPQVVLPSSYTVKSDMETVSMEPATFEGSSEDFIEGPSLHSIQKEANAEAWKKIRPRMLKAIVENEAMPTNQLCILCTAELAVLRCRKCGPFAFLCNPCFFNAHNQVNLFHIAEEWKVGLCVIGLVISQHL